MAVEYAKSSDACHLPPLPLHTTFWPHKPHGTVCYIRVPRLSLQRDWCLSFSTANWWVVALWCTGGGIFHYDLWGQGRDTRRWSVWSWKMRFRVHALLFHWVPSFNWLPALQYQTLTFLHLFFPSSSSCLQHLRHLERACHPLCLVMSVRRACRLPRVQLGLLLCLSPLGHLPQLQPLSQQHQAR